MFAHHAKLFFFSLRDTRKNVLKYSHDEKQFFHLCYCKQSNNKDSSAPKSVPQFSIIRHAKKAEGAKNMENVDRRWQLHHKRSCKKH